MRTISLVNRIKWEVGETVNPRAIVVGDLTNDQGRLLIYRGQGSSYAVPGAARHPEFLQPSPRPWAVYPMLGIVTVVTVGDIRARGHNSLVVLCSSGELYIFDHPWGAGEVVKSHGALSDRPSTLPTGEAGSTDPVIVKPPGWRTTLPQLATANSPERHLPTILPADRLHGPLTTDEAVPRSRPPTRDSDTQPPGHQTGPGSWTPSVAGGSSAGYSLQDRRGSVAARSTSAISTTSRHASPTDPEPPPPLATAPAGESGSLRPDEGVRSWFQKNKGSGRLHFPPSRSPKAPLSPISEAPAPLSSFTADHQHHHPPPPATDVWGPPDTPHQIQHYSSKFSVAYNIDQILIADYDQDGGNEIIMAGTDGFLYAYALFTETEESLVTTPHIGSVGATSGGPLAPTTAATSTASARRSTRSSIRPGSQPAPGSAGAPLARHTPPSKGPLNSRNGTPTAVATLSSVAAAGVSPYGLGSSNGQGASRGLPMARQRRPSQSNRPGIAAVTREPPGPPPLQRRPATASGSPTVSLAEQLEEAINDSPAAGVYRGSRSGSNRSSYAPIGAPDFSPSHIMDDGTPTPGSTTHRTSEGVELDPGRPVSYRDDRYADLHRLDEVLRSGGLHGSPAGSSHRRGPTSVPGQLPLTAANRRPSGHPTRVIRQTQPNNGRQTSDRLCLKMRWRFEQSITSLSFLPYHPVLRESFLIVCQPGGVCTFINKLGIMLFTVGFPSLPPAVSRVPSSNASYGASPTEAGSRPPFNAAAKGSSRYPGIISAVSSPSQSPLRFAHSPSQSVPELSLDGHLAPPTRPDPSDPTRPPLSRRPSGDGRRNEFATVVAAAAASNTTRPSPTTGNHLRHKSHDRATGDLIFPSTTAASLLTQGLSAVAPAEVVAGVACTAADNQGVAVVRMDGMVYLLDPRLLDLSAVPGYQPHLRNFGWPLLAEHSGPPSRLSGSGHPTLGSTTGPRAVHGPIGTATSPLARLNSDPDESGLPAHSRISSMEYTVGTPWSDGGLNTPLETGLPSLPAPEPSAPATAANSSTRHVSEPILPSHPSPLLAASQPCRVEHYSPRARSGQLLSLPLTADPLDGPLRSGDQIFALQLLPIPVDNVAAALHYLTHRRVRFSPGHAAVAASATFRMAKGGYYPASPVLTSMTYPHDDAGCNSDGQAYLYPIPRNFVFRQPRPTLNPRAAAAITAATAARSLSRKSSFASQTGRRFESAHQQLEMIRAGTTAPTTTIATHVTLPISSRSPLPSGPPSSELVGTMPYMGLGDYETASTRGAASATGASVPPKRSRTYSSLNTFRHSTANLAGLGSTSRRPASPAPSATFGDLPGLHVGSRASIAGPVATTVVAAGSTSRSSSGNYASLNTSLHDLHNPPVHSTTVDLSEMDVFAPPASLPMGPSVTCPPLPLALPTTTTGSANRPVKATPTPTASPFPRRKGRALTYSAEPLTESVRPALPTMGLAPALRRNHTTAGDTYHDPPSLARSIGFSGPNSPATEPTPPLFQPVGTGTRPARPFRVASMAPETPLGMHTVHVTSHSVGGYQRGASSYVPPASFLRPHTAAHYGPVGHGDHSGGGSGGDSYHSSFNSTPMLLSPMLHAAGPGAVDSPGLAAALAEAHAGGTLYRSSTQDRGTGSPYAGSTTTAGNGTGSASPRALLVATTGNGVTSIVNPVTKETVQFQFPRRTVAFTAGCYALERDRNVPCLFYVDDNESIYMYYDVHIGRAPVPNLAETLQPELSAHPDALAYAIQTQNSPLLYSPALLPSTVPGTPKLAAQVTTTTQASADQSPKSTRSSRYPPLPPIDTSVSRQSSVGHLPTVNEATTGPQDTHKAGRSLLNFSQMAKLIHDCLHVS
ncbi:hypothetical protein IWQ60_005438 [Tieghemiomyces parasiticus]|uniref:Uncharacterized protein n=1 Tax=Tieghemiomyces parasiticus TaxID=78921 RepID=A0A9W8ACD4_9FUNG|nr:hypothetical protein IWQ60_005438 [Tieghemiomyces parasiticus]